MKTKRLGWFGFSAFALVATSALAAGPATAPATPVYDPAADATAEIKLAETKASMNNERVMLIIGGNWCPWCIKLNGVLTTDKTIKTALRNDYEVVHVDFGDGSEPEKNVPLLKSYGIQPSGYPYIAYLDAATDKLIKQEETGQLEKGPGYDNDVILAHLKANAPAQQDANAVFQEALSTAKRENKQVFLRFGAPWCGWCHVLDGVLAQPGVLPALQNQFVIVKIDIDKMVGGADLNKKYQTTGGIPWFAVLSSDGQTLSKSELNGQNFGFPSEPEEIAATEKMLSAPLSADDAATVNKAFETKAAEIKAKMAAEKANGK
jgi:thioredoxin-related protein